MATKDSILYELVYLCWHMYVALSEFSLNMSGHQPEASDPHWRE